MKNDKNVNNSKPLHKKKRGSRIYVFMGFVLFFVTAVYLATNKYFMIEDILVSGNNKYANEDIIACSKIEKGQNLFKINPKQIKEDLIDKYEYIQDVKVKVTFPTAIILEIQQAEPYALFKDKDEYFMVSEKGRVLERTDNLGNTKMPIVMGMGKIKSPKKENKLPNLEDSSENSSSSGEDNNINNSSSDNMQNSVQSVLSANSSNSDIPQIKPGDYISKENNETLAMLNCLLEAFEKTDFTGVTKIDITDRLNIKIVYQDRLFILLGSEDNLEYKLNFVKNISEYKEDTNFEGVIDATIPKQLRVREMDIDSLINNDEKYNDNYQVPEIISSESSMPDEEKENKENISNNNLETSSENNSEKASDKE